MHMQIEEIVRGINLHQGRTWNIRQPIKAVHTYFTRSMEVSGILSKQDGILGSTAENKFQIADALTSLCYSHEDREHWLHVHNDATPQLLSLFADFPNDSRLTLLVTRLFDEIRSCATCVVAYHAAKASLRDFRTCLRLKSVSSRFMGDMM